MAAYRAPSLLQPHKTRQAIADAHTGEIPPLIGIFTAWASPQIHKVVAQLGFDFVWVEWEHAKYMKIVHDIHLVSEGRSAALVHWA
ncbi:MAG: hypothetical protein LQ337_001478 [Flavoplaca oasis]|nr:MAG: hypothetical protein LQ337_001478 [Flavoplaca oasis]